MFSFSQALKIWCRFSCLTEAGYEDATSAPGYVVHCYRPRIEGLFARIERWD